MAADIEEHHAPAGQSGCSRQLPVLKRLSGKLLVLTILFVLIAEILIFVPSIATMRVRWLNDRLNTAAAASVVLAATDAAHVPRAVQNDVLMATGAKAIALREKGASRLLAVSEMPPEVERHIDLDGSGPVTEFIDAFDTLINGGSRNIRVFGSIGNSDKTIEMVTSDAPLRNAMLEYARVMTVVSLLISLITAGLVFLAITVLLIRPIRRMSDNMLAFSEAPDDPHRIIRPDERADELGIAQRELAAMQSQLQRTLSEQKHLADLGLAVSKINHDMRNILASAQLMSDNLASTTDPAVKRFAPKLIRTLDRAIDYSESVLAYGRAQEAPPQWRRVNFHMLVVDVEETLGIELRQGIEFRNLVPETLEFEADPEQFFRILTNLCRNSIQAINSDSDPSVVKRITVNAGHLGNMTIIGIEDTGPGLSPQARENLFAAFRGSTRRDGTGLGLAIAQELVRAHGGTIELRDDRATGAHFEIRIPDQPVSLADWRRQRDQHAS